MTREAAGEMLRPTVFMEVGQKVGAAAAQEARRIGKLTKVQQSAHVGNSNVVVGEVREGLGGVRPLAGQWPMVTVGAQTLPVLGDYDVVVVGGGTAGAPAAIAAARQSARTLVVENLHVLGGVGTAGLIGLYYYGYQKGFAKEVEEAIKLINPSNRVVSKMEFLRREVLRTGGKIWCGALACGALVDHGRVRGVIVATGAGRGVVLAKVLIDATGNADIASAAGAGCVYTDGGYFAVQTAGLPPRELGASLVNLDSSIIDDVDLVDVWTALVAAKQHNRDAYDYGQLVDTRERRRIVGDYTLSPLDIVNRRTFADTVAINAGGPLDKHSFTVHPFYYIRDWNNDKAYTPYRCLLPDGLDGLLVVGLGVSAHPDAVPAIRMQRDVENLGYAAGVAAALAARSNQRTRDIDIRQVQQVLVQERCLPTDVLTQTDSYPLSAVAVQGAVEILVSSDYGGLGVLMACETQAVACLREAWGRSGISAAGRLRCAHVLGMLGDASGIETLVATVRGTTQWDSQSIGQYCPRNTWLDSYIIALGRTGDARAVPAILEKLSLLTSQTNRSSSHIWAVAMALSALRPREAAPLLSQYLQTSGVRVEPVCSVQDAIRHGRDWTGQNELVLAKALWDCGDYHHRARQILDAYTHDVRGHFARFAQTVLAGERVAAQ